MKYKLNDIIKICEVHKLVPTYSNNDFTGLEVIQIAREGEEDYFGQFNQYGENQFIFQFTDF